MKNLKAATYFIFCLVASGSCKQESQHSLGYYYFLRVYETNPMKGVQNSIAVEIRTVHKTQQKYADLVNYARYELLNDSKRAVPADTFRTMLHRMQTDSIYYLARQVFTIPTQPTLRLDSHPFPPSAHDLDNYLDVSFSPYEGAGPTFNCSGHQEHNKAAYTLYSYLTRLSTRFISKPR